VKQETADGKIVLVAEAAGGAVTVALGPYEEHEKALKLLRIEPAFRPYVVEGKAPAEAAKPDERLPKPSPQAPEAPPRPEVSEPTARPREGGAAEAQLTQGTADEAEVSQYGGHVAFEVCTAGYLDDVEALLRRLRSHKALSATRTTKKSPSAFKSPRAYPSTQPCSSWTRKKLKP